MNFSPNKSPPLYSSVFLYTAFISNSRLISLPSRSFFSKLFLSLTWIKSSTTIINHLHSSSEGSLWLIYEGWLGLINEEEFKFYDVTTITTYNTWNLQLIPRFYNVHISAKEFLDGVVKGIDVIDFIWDESGITVLRLETDDLVSEGENLLQPVRHALVEFLLGFYLHTL